MRPIGYRLNVEVSGIEELKEACKEVSKKAEELQEAIDRLSEMEVNATADYVRSSKAEETTNYQDDKQQKAFLEDLLTYSKALKKKIFIQRLLSQQMEFIWSKQKSFTRLMKLNWIDDALEVKIDELR